MKKFFLTSLIMLFSFATPASAASHTTTLFKENFNGDHLNPHVWEIHQNNGSVLVNSGIVTLSSSELNQFPFIQLKNNSFPTNKPFTLSWSMKYLSHGYNGDGFTFAFARQNPDLFCDPLHDDYQQNSVCTALGGIIPNDVALYSGGYTFNPVNDTEWHTYSLSCNPTLSDLKCSLSIDSTLFSGWGINSDKSVVELPYIANVWFGLPGDNISNITGISGNWSPFQLNSIIITSP